MNERFIYKYAFRWYAAGVLVTEKFIYDETLEKAKEQVKSSFPKLKIEDAVVERLPL